MHIVRNNVHDTSSQGWAPIAGVLFVLCVYSGFIYIQANCYTYALIKDHPDTGE